MFDKSAPEAGAMARMCRLHRRAGSALRAELVGVCAKWWLVADPIIVEMLAGSIACGEELVGTAS